MFTPGNQLQRPALLLTHTTVNSQTVTNLYISFGTVVNEISPTQVYHGWVFGYVITYGTGATPVSVAQFTTSPSPFDDTPSGQASGVFPPASSAAPGQGPAGSGPYLNPSCDQQGMNCYDGDNWFDTGGHGGGIWMSAKGPSADKNGNVYVASGNGPFACTNPSNSSCLNGSNVVNYGESVIALSSGTVTPEDFFTPNALHYPNDMTPGSQFQALNRYDLDFGTPGVILFGSNLNNGAQTWAVTADKTGYAYVMPTPGSGSNVSLGQYQPGDAGLTSPTATYTTQQPFAASRAMSNPVCPAPAAQQYMNGKNCDQIMQLAFWNNMLFGWPWHETAMTFQGTPTFTSSTQKYNYQFGARVGACSAGGVDAFTCANFPQALFPGGNMAIAANGDANATLWAAVTYANQGSVVSGLYGYQITSTTPYLANIFNPAMSLSNAGNCTGLPAVPTSWTPSSFADPTLANNRVYLAVASASNSSGVIKGGVIQVFGACQ